MCCPIQWRDVLISELIKNHLASIKHQLFFLSLWKVSLPEVNTATQSCACVDFLPKVWLIPRQVSSKLTEVTSQHVTDMKEPSCSYDTLMEPSSPSLTGSTEEDTNLLLHRTSLKNVGETTAQFQPPELIGGSLNILSQARRESYLFSSGLFFFRFGCGSSVHSVVVSSVC